MEEWEKLFLESLAANKKWDDLHKAAGQAERAAEEYRVVANDAAQKYYKAFEAYLKKLEYKKERGL